GRLASAAPRQLVAALGSPNEWRRDTAQRLLLERRDASAVRFLRSLACDSKPANPVAQARALQLLESFRALDDKTLRRGLESHHPAVRENAIQLAEPRLAK